MTREDIEKAALKGVEEYVNSGNLKGFRGSYCKGFMEGANWRINSVWHDAKDTPQERRFCLYILKDGSYGCGYYHKRDNTIWYESFEKVDKWAYFEDLIPNVEEES